MGTGTWIIDTREDKSLLNKTKNLEKPTAKVILSKENMRSQEDMEKAYEFFDDASI